MTAKKFDLVRLVWNEPWTGEDGDHMYLELLDDDDIQVDAVDLADYPGAWDTEDPYALAEADLLARNGISGPVPTETWW